jgi:hypothetical protein
VDSHPIDKSIALFLVSRQRWNSRGVNHIFRIKCVAQSRREEKRGEEKRREGRRREERGGEEKRGEEKRRVGSVIVTGGERADEGRGENAGSEVGLGEMKEKRGEKL